MTSQAFVFTVATPTFNRAHLLPRVYRSLKRQTFTDFEWLIIDDGSTDDTKDVVAGWQKKNVFKIRYYWQENAHKKVALNRAVKEAQGKLFLPLDSDDELLPDALEILFQHWKRIPDSERHLFSGVTGLCVDSNGRVVGSRFPQDVIDSNSLAMFYRYRVEGEKCGFIRTDILRVFTFPEDIDGHVPEKVVWFAITRYYNTRFVNDIVRIYHAAPESITLSGRSVEGLRRNAEGHTLWAREVVCNEWRWFVYRPAWILKMAANYTRFHIHLKHLRRGRRWPLAWLVPRLLVLMMWPVDFVRYRLDLRRRMVVE